MNAPHHDAIVVGGGAVGMCSALALAQSGRRVAVLDRGLAGADSSWAGAGLLAPMRPWDYPASIWRLCVESRALYPALADTLLRATGIDVQFLECGARLHDPRCHARATDWLERQGLAYTWERDRGIDWLRMPWFGQIRNPRLVKALRMALPGIGVTVLEHAAMRRLRVDGDGRVTGVEARRDGETLVLDGADVVLATGAWSGGIVPDAPPVTPVRGQMLLLATPRPLPAGVWLLPDSYLVVRADGRCLLGATLEDAGFDKTVTASARVRLRDSAERWLPELRGATVVQQWSGLRPGITDGEPVIGADATRPGLWWNTGHYRNGLAMAPASARRLTAAMDGAAGG